MYDKSFFIEKKSEKKNNTCEWRETKRKSKCVCPISASIFSNRNMACLSQILLISEYLLSSTGVLNSRGNPEGS